MGEGNQYLRGGFAKGTRVQRRDGLCAIDSIAIGDEVLSGQNDHFGQPMFRKVTHVLHWPQLQVHRLRYSFQDGDKEPTRSFITMTENVRLWAGLVPGWVPLCGLHLLGETLRESWPSPRGDLSVQPETAKTIYRTEQAGVGWIEDHTQFEIQGREGSLFNYAEYKPLNPSHAVLNGHIYDSENPFLCVDVYHLVVEETHSFYVGTQLLVHDAFQKVLYNPNHYY